MIPPLGPASPGPATPTSDAVLRARSIELEGRFLAEMLRHAGSAKPAEAFGGGAGEEQFASFLRDAQADAIARKGGIGLAEHLFNALKGRANVGG